MIALFHEVCHECSKRVTQKYSTSFSSAIRLLHADLRQPIYDIYGFVRFADEIVDTFHSYDKNTLLDEFEEETWKAIKNGISLNPILHSFQYAVKRYSIPHHLIEAFLCSMRADLSKSNYANTEELTQYIYGSAEVVGLMCLCVFCEGDMALYDQLLEPAKKLGAAFQKINFLRDLEADINNLNRSYFPNINAGNWCQSDKCAIEKDIEDDLGQAITGIRRLPLKARFGVYTAYRYYRALFQKIKRTHPDTILRERVRVPDYKKLLIVLQAGMYSKMNKI